jgi:hypothetical protein
MWVAQGNTIDLYVPPPLPELIDEADLDEVNDQLRALAMVIANATGTPMAEIKQRYRTAMDAILNQQG